MLIDKEYPATHSMSTSWFIADNDGNVAIFDFNENGPIPCNIPESSADGVLEDDFVFPDKQGVRNFNFNDKQADLIIECLNSVEKFEECEHYIVLIDVAQTDRFLQSALRCNYLSACYSKSKGLYLIDTHGGEDQAQEMLQNGVILKAEVLYLFETDDRYDKTSDSVLFTHDDILERFPFYLYQQPYWTDFLTERTFVPKHKFNIKQFNPKDQKRVLRLPVNFDECSKLQIAEFLPSGCTGSDYESIENHNFALLPMSDGNSKYVRIDFPGVGGWSSCYTEKPTILFIGLKKDRDLLFKQDPVLCTKSNTIFPYETLFFEKEEPVRKTTGKIDQVFLSKIQTLFPNWNDYFSCYADYWDEVFDIVNPHVVVIEDGVFEKVARDLNILDKKISILGKEYPYFLLSELNDQKNNIESLANLPYRGKKFLYSLDKETMDKWLKMQ